MFKIEIKKNIAKQNEKHRSIDERVEEIKIIKKWMYRCGSIESMFQFIELVSIEGEYVFCESNILKVYSFKGQYAIFCGME